MPFSDKELNSQLAHFVRLSKKASTGILLTGDPTERFRCILDGPDCQHSDAGNSQFFVIVLGKFVPVCYKHILPVRSMAHQNKLDFVSTTIGKKTWYFGEVRK